MENINIENTTNQTTQATDTTAVPTLPAGYLDNGYYATTDKGLSYMRPELVGQHAQEIAAALAEMKPSDFSGLLRELKRNKKKALPFEARQSAVLELLPKSLALVHRRKAPALLTDFVRANLDAIKTDDDWTAFFRHIEAIQNFIISQ